MSNEELEPVILIIDSDTTDYKSGEVNPRKRKLSPNFCGKVEWTDDESDSYVCLKDAKQSKPSRRRGRSGKSDRLSHSIKGKEKENVCASLPSGDGTDIHKVEVAEHVRSRRRRFNKTRETLKISGLRLPPDFRDIEFSEDENMETLARRPQFPSTSGAKPCRPYKDVELDRSAGLIPAPVAQYLRDYQVEGANFLHQHFVYQTGCILGDDMGLGKTVQVVAFLTAAFGKTSDERDWKRMRKMRHEMPDAWYPRALIVCPGSLIENWRNELTRWGWWHIDVYHGAGKDDVLDATRAGWVEVMITTYGTYKNHYVKINKIEWDVAIADECHCLKEPRSEITRAMNEINALCRIGLTGTAIQNRYEELWTLLNWTNPSHFGSLREWREIISRPLTVGQSHDATFSQLSLARKTAQKLVRNLLPPFFLRRLKSLIAHQLPKKRDRVVFCPLTDLQKDAYSNFLASKSVEFIRSAEKPCDCGSGRKRGWCCYTHIPETGQKWQSLVFPTMTTLQKLSSHITLLVPATSDSKPKKESELRVLQDCVPEIWNELFQNRDSLLNLVNPKFCGKWRVLKKLLEFWYANSDKVLIFSHSVRLLKILQYLLQTTSYTVSYLDGGMGYEERQRTVDSFNSNTHSFVFLISTKAGGVGLNIASANKVVIVDPHWNPAYDLQAQDRAYRIGQVRDVDVFRLISAGTIEEIVYARQIYKQQQANIGYSASEERRYFKGVQQDRARKGEIFGLGNLLTFHKDTIMLREIVNKTNIAEAKAGIALANVDLEKAVPDSEESLNMMGMIGNDSLTTVPTATTENTEHGESGHLANFFIKETSGQNHEVEGSTKISKHKKSQSDAIQAILSAAGVEYTHQNSEVVGSSKVEKQLSRRAIFTSECTNIALGNKSLLLDNDENQNPHFGNHNHDEINSEKDSNIISLHAGPRKKEKQSSAKPKYLYNPPEEVRRRQFCTMARTFGFLSAQEFGLAVESWTQEQRRDSLEEFYRKRRHICIQGVNDNLPAAQVTRGNNGNGNPDVKPQTGKEDASAKNECEGDGMSLPYIKTEDNEDGDENSLIVPQSDYDSTDEL